ncbi:ABC transporter ATP-binding protein [Neotabrizicola shimadae]|uniref:Sn-glycerol-3-phosphate ABC transporter ATP-binding protein UgpC n=1 Tax=Neotabrizicola shimadae TaxID=2807096 RepID=A0A8G1EC41_9RHOB|nr:sn-glycerol-3-phosphate ABC transporter ATP-binding protein UgpC [Neotabrizicola shimadae]QYZ68786.1 sn-glycerol-3-phosphate ABC transporter ATP-binding protein UgpC [Neotabrizicola shimadae]
MSELVLSGVTKSFGGAEVIKGVDLAIEKGEFVVFVGPSGCGKSTLLRMIAGLESVSGGTIAIGGRAVTDAEPWDRGIAMVFQSYALYPHMTVAENMGFALRLQGVPPAERRKAVEQAARILQIEPLLDRKPAQLSGGQRQRVAIGRAIVRQPRVFLFDEPLSNLDAELRVQTRIEIARLHRQLGATMIYVTHDQVEAMTLADRIVVLRGGRIEQVGRPTDLYDDPDNAFVAGFIGSPKMNFLSARVLGPRTVQVAGQTLDLPHLRDALPQGRDLQLGIRPEHIGSGTGLALTLAIDVVEQLGATAYVIGAPQPGLTLVAEARGLRPQVGDSLTVHLPPAQVLLFDETGRRLR